MKNNVKKFLQLHSKFLQGKATDDELLEMGELSENMDRIASEQSEKSKRYKSYKFKKKI